MIFFLGIKLLKSLKFDTENILLQIIFYFMNVVVNRNFYIVLHLITDHMTS